MCKGNNNRKEPAINRLSLHKSTFFTKLFWRRRRRIGNKIDSRSVSFHMLYHCYIIGRGEEAATNLQLTTWKGLETVRILCSARATNHNSPKTNCYCNLLWKCTKFNKTNKFQAKLCRDRKRTGRSKRGMGAKIEGHLLCSWHFNTILIANNSLCVKWFDLWLRICSWLCFMEFNIGLLMFKAWIMWLDDGRTLRSEG